MDLSAGGHLTHGSPVNFSGKTYNFVSYGVDPATEVIDYNVVRILARKHQPKLIVAGASAYSRHQKNDALVHRGDHPAKFALCRSTEFVVSAPRYLAYRGSSG